MLEVVLWMDAFACSHGVEICRICYLNWTRKNRNVHNGPVLHVTLLFIASVTDNVFFHHVSPFFLTDHQ